MGGFVYIFEDDLHKHYIGSSANVLEREKKHLSRSVHTTKRMKKPHVVLIQEYSTIEEARSVERKLKKLKRKDYITQIINDGFIKIKP